MLSEARQQKTEQVEFASRAALLRALGFGIDRANMRRLDEALELWSVLSIQFDCWYFAGRRLPSGQDVDRQQARGVLATGGCSTFTPRRVAHRAGHKKGSRGEKKRRLYKTGTRGEKKLAPPLRLDLGSARRVRVHISQDWSQDWQGQQQNKYYEKLPLPLPRTAAAQNLVLCVSASKMQLDPEDFDSWHTGPRSVRSLTRKLGVNHSTRNLVLQNALDEADAWFRQHGGMLVHAIKHGRINFVLTKPDEPRPVRQPTPTEPVQLPAASKSRMTLLCQSNHQLVLVDYGYLRRSGQRKFQTEPMKTVSKLGGGSTRTAASPTGRMARCSRTSRTRMWRTNEPLGSCVTPIVEDGHSYRRDA